MPSKPKNKKQEIKLRERCVKYALKFSPTSPGMATRIEDLVHDSQQIYEFITASGHLPTLRDRE